MSDTRIVAVLSGSFAKTSRQPVEHLEANGFAVDFRPSADPGNEEKVAELIGDAPAAIVTAQDRIGEIVFERCRNLRVVAIHGVGCDAADIAGAAKHGIMVRTCPGNHESVADLTWLLILAASRNLLHASAAVRAGEWQPSAHVGVEVLGKTIGIVGFGRIGRAVARRAVGFENKVLVYDPFVSELEPVDGLHMRTASFEELLTESDIVTLHLPLMDDTRQMMDADAIGKMKDSAIFVNTARGGLVDEAALRQALDSGKIRMAGLDTFAAEPPADSPLPGMEQVIPTPHMGAQTVDANVRTGMLAAEMVVEKLRSSNRT